MKKFKQLLNESLRGEEIGCKMLNLLFYTKRYPELEVLLIPKFPIDEKYDDEKLNGLAYIISKNLNIDFTVYQVKESETFVSANNYSLTILNKYFTSNLSIRLKMFKFLNKRKNKLNSANIHILHKKFHSRFGTKTIT